MTHSTIAAEAENSGSMDVVYHTIDITATDALGSESYDPEAEVGVDVSDHGIAVAGQADAGYVVKWDHTTGQFQVKYGDNDAAADGPLIDVPAGTAVGQVRLRVEGR